MYQRDPVCLGRLQPHPGPRLHPDMRQRHPGGLRLPEVRVRRAVLPVLEADQLSGINLCININNFVGGGRTKTKLRKITFGG